MSWKPTQLQRWLLRLHCGHPIGFMSKETASSSSLFGGHPFSSITGAQSNLSSSRKEAQKDPTQLFQLKFQIPTTSLGTSSYRTSSCLADGLLIDSSTSMERDLNLIS
ncbi:hypothetical protein CDAR_21881 [Caerostris darwini]|uniref:Uncharacterized protein n=1 Tax=Caerostris darwini TaxID=1538125 RepID=A0AAV4VVM7_9ARAC|nr:hypothetical protein CDAR_21881 [Caerostris darwini]